MNRIVATHAINYLLGLYEAKGLSVVTAPMSFNMPAGQANVANATMGTMVVRNTDGKLNISEPIGDFFLNGPEEVVKDALAELAKIDVGPERVQHSYALRFLQVADAKDKLDKLFGDAGLMVIPSISDKGDVTAPAQQGGTSGRYHQ